MILMSGHGHSHNHGAGGGGCDHGQAGKVGEETGLSYSLYQKIDMTNLNTLNEELEDSGKTVFKPWESRLDREKFVLSDCDEELLINIPFTGCITSPHLTSLSQSLLCQAMSN